MYTTKTHSTPEKTHYTHYSHWGYSPNDEFLLDMFIDDEVQVPLSVACLLIFQSKMKVRQHVEARCQQSHRLGDNTQLPLLGLGWMRGWRSQPSNVYTWSEMSIEQCLYLLMNTVLNQDTPKWGHLDKHYTFAVSNTPFVHITAPKIRTRHYKGHFLLSQWWVD